MTSSVRYASLVVLAACQWGGGPGPGPNGQQLDAKTVDGKTQKDAPMADARRSDAAVDSLTADAAIDAPPNTQHLLMTELTVSPDGAEFIELWNPTPATVDLSTYYLSNHGSYYALPVNGQTIPFAHFIVKFPAGASLAPGQVIVIATQGAAPFTSFYGSAPTYSITDGTMTAVTVNNTPRLTDGGATVVLFQWDGASGLVKDVDIMIVGTPSLTNVLVDKSGVVQNGATYATDANTIAAQPSAPGIDSSTKRIAREDGREVQTGAGNGITGHDETSENTAVTWDSAFSAPTPGTIPAL
jgi:hypothetical protein